MSHVVRAAVDLGGGHGQSWRQIWELLLAFFLASLIGLERELRGKSAGLRTQAIVGTTSALILLVSKYGFDDVLLAGRIVLDPSRVAAQIVSGIGFLGAGLILTRHSAVRGLTTAASVWETAAIGMAAGAGLPLLAVVVTGLHFVTVFGYNALARVLPGSRATFLQVRVRYLDDPASLRAIMAAAGSAGWHIGNLSQAQPPEPEQDQQPNRAATVTLSLSGSGHPADLLAGLLALPGVLAVTREAHDDLG